MRGGWLVCPLLLGILCCVGCGALPLQVGVAGCDALLDAPDGVICELKDPPARLHLLVQAPGDSQIDLGPAGPRGPTIEDNRPAPGPFAAARVLTVQVPPATTELTVRARRWPRAGQTQIHLRRRAAPTPARQRAEALSEQGFRARQAQHLDQAQALLLQALAADRQAGVLRAEAEDAVTLSWTLGHDLQRPAAAEAVLAERGPLFQRVPDYLPWMLLQRALLRRAQGDRREVFDLLEQAEAWAQVLGDLNQVGEIAMQRAGTLALVGRLAEAQAQFDRAQAAVRDPCRRASVLSSQGFTFTRARATLPADHPLWKRLDPAPVLQQAVALSRGCQPATHLANALTNQAHAAAAAGRFTEVAARLAEARAALGQADPDPDLAAEWTDLEGQRLLSEGRHADAAARFAELGAQAQRLGHGAGDSWEMAWRALLGQARAQEHLDPAEALRLYARAEAHLDQRSLDIPLGLGRGTFLGGTEDGAASYIELLVQRGQVDQAARVARCARARGLRGLEVLTRADELSRAERQRFEGELAAYQAARLQLDRLTAQWAQAAAADRPGLKASLDQATEGMVARMDRALAALGVAPGPPQLRELRDGEVALLCHPRPGASGAARPGWRCFAWDRAGADSAAVPRMDQAGLAEAVAALSGKLRPAQRLRVIPYGDMRDLSVEHLRLDGVRLSDRLLVEYALDAPFAAAPARSEAERRTSMDGAPLRSALSMDGAPLRSALSMKGAVRGRAFVLYDPQANAPGTNRAGQQLGAVLRAAGHEVTLQGPMGFSDPAQLTGAGLRALLEQSDLFAYLGHGLYADAGGWRHQLVTSEEHGLLVSDVLLLRRAPRRAVVFACNAGRSGEEVGGIEGLGVAQALVLRGSAWVMTTVREISDAAAEAVAASLGEQRDAQGQGLMGDVDPAVLLRGALRAAAGHPRLQRLLREQPTATERDLLAFRVLVP